MLGFFYLLVLSKVCFGKWNLNSFSPDIHPMANRQSLKCDFLGGISDLPDSFLGVVRVRKESQIHNLASFWKTRLKHLRGTCLREVLHYYRLNRSENVDAHLRVTLFVSPGFFCTYEVLFLVFIEICHFGRFDVDFFVVWVENFHFLTEKCDVIQSFFCDLGLVNVLVLDQTRKLFFHENHFHDISESREHVVQHF